MLCVDRDIPIVGAPNDGNASDKTLNNELLSDISRHMASYSIEKNFDFLKNPVIVNSIFLKKAPPHQGAGSDLTHNSAYLAPDGTFLAPVC